MKRVRIRPSKSSSALGMVVGLVMLGIGLIMVIPTFGLFGILWTFIAAAITVVHAVNVFSERGIATTEIDVDGGALFSGADRDLPFDERLRRLEQLRQEGLITEQEYQQKREELMRSQW